MTHMLPLFFVCTACPKLDWYAHVYLISISIPIANTYYQDSLQKYSPSACRGCSDTSRAWWWRRLTNKSPAYWDGVLEYPENFGWMSQGSRAFHLHSVFTPLQGLLTCMYPCWGLKTVLGLTLIHSTFNPVQGHGVLTSASPEQATDNSHFNLSFLSTASLYWIAPWSVAKEADVSSVSGVCFLGYFVTHPQM